MRELEGKKLLAKRIGVTVNELEDNLDHLMERFNWIQQMIICYYYGISWGEYEPGRCYSLEEIGKKLRLVRERIRQLHDQAIRRMSRFFRLKIL